MSGQDEDELAPGEAIEVRWADGAARWETWVRIDDGRGAIRPAVDPVTGEHYVAGLVLFGPVTNARLKALRLREVVTPASWEAWTMLPAGWVPTEDLLAEVEWTAVDHAAGGMRVIHDGAGVSVVDGEGATVVQWWPRRIVADMPTAEWFEQTADLYRVLEVAYPAGPTKALGEVCGVPFTTAVRWVRECRNRGILPRSSKQLGKTKGEPA